MEGLSLLSFINLFYNQYGIMGKNTVGKMPILLYLLFSQIAPGLATRDSFS